MRVLVVSLLSIFVLISCKEVEVNQYEVNPVGVTSGGADKSQLKSDLQLLSIMFSDVFGRAISQSELQDLADTYNSFGDKQVIIDRLTWRFLNDASAQLPTDTELQTDPAGVITSLYERYYSRTPGEMEVWYYQNWLSDNPDLGVLHLAFVLLTADEYKYY
ncbi:hypothetical protein [Phaeocystidibacter luteus]|uniref:DUF4214 domain-containing protein n=1 Tax=Phaeocystidibacter luteus TaxID=911197 RepID=A0A6N6RFD9_9FLAO|nr:hypothetical protein [Phaeocystidibacter luteus]KAB2808045.1 hypothetical protein F8C67_10765 [Phaeocystidibacter luteus]